MSKKKKTSIIYPMNVAELLYVSARCKDLNYIRENVISKVVGMFNSLRVKSNTKFLSSDINDIKNIFYKKFGVKLSFDDCGKQNDFYVGYFLKTSK